MTQYRESRDNKALEILIERSEAAEKLTPAQMKTLDAAKRILADRCAAKVAPHVDMPRTISFLTSVAN